MLSAMPPTRIGACAEPLRPAATGAVLLGARALHEHAPSIVQLPVAGSVASFKVDTSVLPAQALLPQASGKVAVGPERVLLQKVALASASPGATITLQPLREAGSEARAGSDVAGKERLALRQMAPAPALVGPSIALPSLPDVGIESQREMEVALPLPPGAEAWTRFERDLYLLSQGGYHPSAMAQKRRIPSRAFPTLGGATGSCFEVRGRVSFVVPTMSSRQHYHQQLWANFEAQQWPDKELVVVESYETEPSAFLQQKATEDSRFVLFSFRVPAQGDYSVGLKRNMTLHLASGEYVVNFDDDDVYAPTYATRMVEDMRARGLAGITLASWFNYFETTGSCGYTDADSWQLDDLDEVLFGYGFSYVHLRRVGLALPYPDVEFAEDYPFFGRLRDVLGASRVALKADTTGLCMHIVHPRNSAGAMPTSRYISMAEVGELEVAPLFQTYLENHATAMVHMYRSVVDRCNLAVESLTGILPSRREGKKLTHRRVKTC